MVKLIHGNNSFYSLKRARDLFDEAKAANPESDITVIDFSENTLEKLFQLLEGQSLFSSSKVVLAKSLSSNKEFKNYQDKIFEAFKNCPEESIIIIWESGKIASNTKYAKFFKSNGNEELFEELKKPEVKKIATTEAQKLGVKFDSEAFDLLLFNTNYNISLVFSELHKLHLLGKEKITVDDIKEIVSNSSEALIWDLTDAISATDRQKAIATIEYLTKNDSDQFMIIPMIGRQLKIMIQIKVLEKSGANQYDIAKELRLPPFILNKTFSHLQKTSLEKLKRLFIKLVDMDYAIKTGKMEPNIALSLFCSII